MGTRNKYPRSYKRDSHSPSMEKTSWSNFQRAVFLWAFLPWKKQEVAKGTGISWEMREEPHRHNLKREQRTRGRREETYKIKSSQVGDRGAIYSTEWYLLPSHNVCTNWQLWLARLLCQHLQVWACAYVQGKGNRREKNKRKNDFAFCLFLCIFYLLQSRNLSVLIPGGDS